MDELSEALKGKVKSVEALLARYKQYEGKISECDEGELHWMMKNEIMNLNV